MDTLKIADYNIDGLYIKLDKKLTLKADHIAIPESKAQPSLNNIHKTLDRIKYVLTFFDYIELKSIVFKNNRLAIIFSDDLLQLESKDYRIRGNVSHEGKMLKATIPLLYIKSHHVTMNGKFTYDLGEDILTTEGKFEFNEMRGEFNASKKEDEVDFTLKSNTFADLRSIVSKFNLNETVKSWVVDKVEADTYKLLSLSGRGTIREKQFKMDMAALRGEALFSGTKIHFKENLEPVLAPSFLLTYEDDGLYFNLEAPTYRDKSLEGSSVSIVNLSEADTALKLDIKMEAPFDATIQHLLLAYGLEIPVLQKSGKVNALFRADMALKNHKNSFVTDVNFSKGDVWIKNLKLPIVNGKLHYEEGFITLKGINLKDTFYEGEVNGKIDLEKKKADLILDAKRIELGEREKKIFVLKNQTLPFTFEYGEKIDIVIPKLDARLASDKNETHIYLADLNKIKPYLPDPGPIEEGGNVDLKTKDFSTYTFSGILKRTSCFLYEKENQCKSRVPFEGNVTASDLDFYAFDKRFHYNKSKSRVKLENLNIDLEKFLKTKKYTEKKEATKKKAKEKEEEVLVIIGKNSNLRYGAYTLVVDSYDVEVKENGNIKAIGSSSGDIIKFAKKKDIISMQALRIKDKVLHPLINFKGLHDGRYSLDKSGTPGGIMKGKIIVEGGVMKGFKAYNNTLAFINTLPALAFLHKPGYSKEGFTIKEGVAEYRMIKGDKIVFDSIYIKGSSATIIGKGEIDLKKKTIKMDLAIQTARELGKLVGNLPLVGYILMGEDKSVTFGLQITGTLDNPTVDTSTAEVILTLPLNILKRTFESPGHIINK